MIRINKRFLTVIVTFLPQALLFGGITLPYAALEARAEKVRSVSAEIAYADRHTDELRLEEEGTGNRRYPAEPGIDRELTKISDPRDVDVEFNWPQGKGRRAAKPLNDVAFTVENIIFGQKTGELETIKARAGILVVDKRYSPEDHKRVNPVYFTFDPEHMIAVRSYSEQCVEQILNAGDIVKGEDRVENGQRRHVRPVIFISEGQRSIRRTRTAGRKIAAKKSLCL